MKKSRLFSARRPVSHPEPERWSGIGFLSYSSAGSGAGSAMISGDGS